MGGLQAEGSLFGQQWAPLHGAMQQPVLVDISWSESSSLGQ